MNNKRKHELRVAELPAEVRSVCNQLLAPTDDDRPVPIHKRIKSSFGGDINQDDCFTSHFIGRDAYKDLIDSRLGN